nr:hypothetical protein [uncultured Acetatifactor sp.]
MGNYVKTILNFIRYHYLPHLCGAALLVLCAGAVLSFCNLDTAGAAKVMERYGVLAGILLFTPLFVPESDMEIWQLEASRYLPMWKLYLGRLFPAVCMLAAVVSILILRLLAGGSVFPVWLLWREAFCEALFLGGIGCFAAAVTNQVALGYMVSVLYYAVNIGMANRLWKFGLFPVCRGEEGTWPWLLGAAAFLTAGGIWLREQIRRAAVLS